MTRERTAHWQDTLRSFAQQAETVAETVAEPESFTHLENMPLLDVMALARLTASASQCKAFTCGIINVKSGACPENCAFCAQSAHHSTEVQTHPFLSSDEILYRVEAKLREKHDFVGLVASGHSVNEREFDALCQSAHRITSRFAVKLCASIGALHPERASALKQAGFTSCHHNLESSRGFFAQVCTTHSHDQRVETVEMAQAAGLRTCCGGLFGLGESFADRCDLAMQLRALGVDSIPLNFLIPIKGTPLANQPTLPPEDALRTIALFRLVNPAKDIVICGGRLEALKTFKNMIFSAGANGLMLGDYLTRPGGVLREDMQDMLTLGVI